jgi:hypothetical protein
MKLLLILMVWRMGEGFREVDGAVLRAIRDESIRTKGEAFRECFVALFLCNSAWAMCFRGFG